MPPVLRSLVAALLLPVLAVACGGDGGGDPAAFCATAEAIVADNPAAALAGVDSGDRAGSAARLRDAAERLGAWAEEAPAEVADDVAMLADAATTLAELFEDPGTGDTADGGADDTAGDTPALDTDAVEAASARLLAYTRETCGVDLDVS